MISTIIDIFNFCIDFIVHIPSFLKLCFDFIYICVSFIPDPFGLILKTFILIYIGIFCIKLVRG